MATQTGQQTDDTQLPITTAVAIGTPADRNDRNEVKTINRSYNGIFAKMMSATSHCIFVSFSIYVLYLSFKTHSLFSWHPSCMTIGSLLLMAEAVMAMSPDSLVPSNLSRQGRVRVHWILQAGAVILIFAGFLVIVINKNLHNKSHFQSWHAIIGLVFLVFVGMTSAGGVATLYSYSLKKCVKPAQIKLIHNAAGIITFVLGVTTVIFGIYTGWFTKNSTYSAQIMCLVCIILGGIFSLESAIKSLYARFIAIRQSQ